MQSVLPCWWEPWSCSPQCWRRLSVWKTASCGRQVGDSSARFTANPRNPQSLLSGNSFVWKLGIWVYHSREPGTSPVGLGTHFSGSKAQGNQTLTGKIFLSSQTPGGVWFWIFFGGEGLAFLVIFVWFWVYFKFFCILCYIFQKCNHI